MKQQEFNLAKLAFVIGNGVSRKELDLSLLDTRGITYGCNALYRDFLPDYLVAVDGKMVLEITKNKIHKKCSVWTNRLKNLEVDPEVNIFDPSNGWSSGPTALNLAASKKHKEIHIIGFDYAGLGDNKDKLNNVYADTANYKKSTDTATYYGNWLRQTLSVIKKHKDIKFLRVYNDNCLLPPEILNLDNLTNIKMSEYQRYLKNI